MLSELGRGAMGVVYKARDPKINRIVAVKTISLAGQPAEDELDYRERFFREAEAAGRISHPGIVTIFDVGEEPETRAPYIVMEFVSGESLDKLLSNSADRKLPVETALRLALELAEALDCAHRQGVVHRDLKPANILVSEDGHAKIADFGVAKLNLSNQTLAGRALGTPAYMSPEQLNGEVVDGRSDLFSLGVILYTVLTGHRPFQGNSAVTVSFKVVNHEPMPATLLDTALPQGLDAVIARAMAKDPGDRYQSGAEMVAAIRELQQERELATHTPPPALGTGAQVVTEKKLAMAATATGQRTYSQPASTQPVSVHPTPGAFKSQSATKTQPNLPTPRNRQIKMHGFAEKFQKKAFAAVAVLVGLFLLGLWVISLGPQAMPPRAAEPIGPAARGSAVSTNASVANSSASTDNAPARGAASATSKDKDKDKDRSRTTHRTDSRSAQSAKNASPLASTSQHNANANANSNSNDPNAPHRADSHSATASHPIVPEVSAIVLPLVTAKVDPSTLEIEVDHKFAEANLSIWVDDALTYTHLLEGTEKKRLGVFHRVEGHELHAMQISPGKHRLRVRVTSDTPTYDQSAFVTSDFASGHENVLQVTFNKHGDINLSLQ